MSLHSLPTTQVGWSGSRRDKQGGIRGPRKTLTMKQRDISISTPVFKQNISFGLISIGKHAAFRVVGSEGRWSLIPVAWHGPLFCLICARHFFEFTSPGRVEVMSWESKSKTAIIRRGVRRCSTRKEEARPD